MAAPRLDTEQRRVLNALLAEGRKISDPRTRRVFERAAVQTGLVESGLRNLSHGDADSLGWRQERASLYPNPTNVAASAARFRREFLQHYTPGEASYDVAWQVQRPREDLRGRYREEAGDAAAILSAYGAGGGGGGGGGGTQPQAEGGAPSTSTTPAPAGTDPGPAQNLAALMQLTSQQQRAPAASTLAPPSFAAKPVMAGPVVASSGGPPAPRMDISALIAASQTQGGSVPAPDPALPANPAGSTPGSPKTTDAGASTSNLVPLGGSKNAGKGRFVISGPNPDRLQSELTSFAKKVAAIYGGPLTGLDGSSHSKLTVNGNVSQHYTGNATDIFTIGGKPAVGARLIRAGRAALIAAGMPRSRALKAPGGLYNVGNHQIIFGVDGVQNGGDHTDHLHISARK